jgi:hypothetical protein
MIIPSAKREEESANGYQLGMCVRNRQIAAACLQQTAVNSIS